MSLSIRHWLAERQIELVQVSQRQQVAGVVFRIAQDMDVKGASPFDICTLAEVLELPLGTAWPLVVPLSQISIELMRILSRKKPLKRNEGTWITFQVAYLNALQGILEQESQLKKPWLDRAAVTSAIKANQPLTDPLLQGHLKTLRAGRLSDTQAEQSLNLVSESFLVQQMASTSIAWLIANGAEETEAKLLIQRLVHGLPGHLLAVIAENALPLSQLQKFVRLGNWDRGQGIGGWVTETNPQSPINLHREFYRATLVKVLSEPLLAEPFALKDLYIPLKGKELLVSEPHSLLKNAFSSNPGAIAFGASVSEAKPLALAIADDATTAVDLMGWVITQLEDKTSVAIIESDPGYGKTSFCQMFAARAAQEFYPKWMPLAIRLRDATLGQTLEQTLDSAFPLGRFTNADGWLSPFHPPCLLILDGLDELPLPCSSPTERHFATFLTQLARFLSQAVPRHKVVLTSRRRGVGSDGDLYSLLPNSRRIVIQPMLQDEFVQWFKLWAKLESKSIAQAYFAFLKQGGVFRASSRARELAALVSQPLMIYLLGVLHRNGLLEDSVFQMPDRQVKFEIYDRICRWLLGEPATGSSPLPELVREGLGHASRTTEAIANLLQGYQPQELRQQMQVAALRILQTGGHKATLGEVEAENSSPQKSLRTENSSQFDLSNLPAFFFKIQTKLRNQNYLEFSHPKLGEYLCAEEIAAQLKSLTEKSSDRYGEISFTINSSVSLAEHIYGLLGYGLMSVDMEEMVIERLREEQARNPATFPFSALFGRLYSFYQAYCRGRWLDEGIAHQVHSRLQALNNPLNTLQIDAAVGLNVFLLLSAIAREAQMPFSPCGHPNVQQEFDADQLLTFIGRTAVLSPTIFWQRSRHSLSQLQLAGVCLNRAMLAEANLWQVNLSGAELIGTNLAAANLQQANLSWANLTGADLSGANLTGARLEGANLTGANLHRVNLRLANLSKACVFQAQMDVESQKIARDNDAIFSLEEFQSYSENLAHTSHIITDNSISGTDQTLLLIESAEGEPILHEDVDDEGGFEPTIILDTSGKPRPSSSNDSDGYGDKETAML